MSKLKASIINDTLLYVLNMLDMAALHHAVNKYLAMPPIGILLNMNSVAVDLVPGLVNQRFSVSLNKTYSLETHFKLADKWEICPSCSWNSIIWSTLQSQLLKWFAITRHNEIVLVVLNADSVLGFMINAVMNILRQQYAVVIYGRKCLTQFAKACGYRVFCCWGRDIPDELRLYYCWHCPGSLRHQ